MTKKTIISLLLMGLGVLLLGSVLVRRLTTPQVVTSGDTVTVHFNLLVDDKTVYYSTDGHDPARYSLSQDQLLPGFEEALIGMQIGDKKTVRLTPTQAYGPYRPELVLVVNRSELPEGSNPTIGQQIKTKLENGNPMVMKITSLTETEVTLDANHPLSGHHLTFEIELVGIEPNQTASSQKY
jgi:peptidylprolyl isomerase